MSNASHSYDIPRRGLLRFLGGFVGGLIASAAIVHIVASIPGLPSPAPADLDRVVISEKARLARRTSPAEIILLGDSSCMMDVDTPRLSEALGKSVLNLGTLSYLGLDAHAALLSHCLRARSEAPDILILLLHPDSLRRSESVPEYREFLRRQLELDDRNSAPRWPRAWDGRGAPAVLRERILQALVPSVVSGAFGTRYGTTWQVARYLRTHHGSLLDPSTFDRSAEGEIGEHRLAARLDEASFAFARQIPAGTRLLVGITPRPASVAATDHHERSVAMLRTWAGWLKAELALVDLPMVMADELFASRTHLNARGVALFTDALTQALGREGRRAPIPR
jgi:hypothetical protein